MIQVHQLSKHFPLPGGGHVVAVHNLSFSVAPGEVYGLLGPNGAGKTTTLRMLLGLLSPTSGQASIAGFASNKAPDEVKRRVGLVSSSAGLYSGLTVRAMLLFLPTFTPFRSYRLEESWNASACCSILPTCSSGVAARSAPARSSALTWRGR